jgi:hypothetical protein
VKVLAARLGTTSGNIAGGNGLARVVEGGSSLLFGFSKRTDLAKSDPIFQKFSKLHLNRLHYRPE